MKRKLLVCIVVSMLVIGCIAGTVYAAKVLPGDSPTYTYTSTIIVGLDVSGGVASVSADITPHNLSNKSSIRAYLQKYDNGWKSIKSWYSGKCTGYSYVNETYSVPSGYSYRVYAVGRVYNSSGDTTLETVDITSDVQP